jgi:hypothetical protein
MVNISCKICSCRFQWPRGLKRGSAAARLLGSRVRIPLGGHGCLSSVDKNPCGGLISRIEECLLHVMSKPQQTGNKDLGPLQ